MLLTTERCVIRDFTKSDAAQLHEVLSDAQVMEYIEPPFTMEQTEGFIESAGLSTPPLVYALLWEETSRVIGHVIFHRYEEDSFEIGWIIHKEYWRRGIAGEVTDALIQYAQKAGAQSCVIECDPQQIVTGQIARKHGFLYEGQDDDCDIYRLIFP